MKPAIIAFAVCVIAAALEGVAAGPGVRGRLASLRVPRWALPFAAWVVVGAVYYGLCFAVLFRLLGLPSSRLQALSLALTLLLMAANAGFNYLFFRRASVYASFLFYLPYAALAVTLFVVLLRVDPLAAAIFSPYLLYFLYATAWGYQVWRLNRSPVDDSRPTHPAA